MRPGAIVHTRMPAAERSRAAVNVSDTTPPFDAEYAAWPIWPSYAATDAVFTITPRWPSSSGSFADIADAASRITLNVPMRLISITRRNVSREWGAPLRLIVRSAQPMPAQWIQTFSGAIADAAAT